MNKGHPLDPDIAREARKRKILEGKKARKEPLKKGGAEEYSQEWVAQRIDSNQNQISMFENGHPGVVGAEKLEKLRELLEPEYSQIIKERKEAAENESLVASGGGLAICGNWECPAAALYVLNREIIARPRFVRIGDRNARRCGFCSDEPLLTKCGECGAPLQPGVRCYKCDRIYVPVKYSVTQSNPDELRQLCQKMNERNRLVLDVIGEGDCR